MSNKLKYSVITGTMGQLSDRFCSSGYKEKDITLGEKLKVISNIKEITAVELCYDIDGDESDFVEVKKLLKKYGLTASVVNAPMHPDRKWRFGTFTSKNGNVRKDAVQMVKDTMDFAEKVGSNIVNIWPGQDGFDYSFQADYSKQWKHFVECVKECADYKKDMKLALEFKVREPRNRCILDTAATTLLIINEVGRENVGMTIDIGHVMQVGQNMAQAVELVSNYGKLFNLHVNDNYAAWDDDMVVGSVHFVEYLELFFILRKVKYDGWLSVDIFPFRENAFEAAKESILYMEKYDQLVEKIGYETLNKLIEQDNPLQALRAIRESVFK
jgi:sugar phosphate isomerase/epimerase